jgi:APA family basic amino acid/polyamine antiporter
MPRPYKVWGYPFVPILFALSMFWIMINTLFEKPFESMVGIILMLAGLPVYYYWQKKQIT